MLVEKKSFVSPEASIRVEKGEILGVAVGALAFAKGRAEPGWRWSLHAKSEVGTESCQRIHHGWVLAGKVHYTMDDGSEEEFGPGDAFAVAPGHDAWVVGTEPFEYIEVFPRMALGI